MSGAPSDPRTEVATQIALASIPPLEVGLATDSGRMPEKQVNEDSALVRATRHGHLAVVCDGMGGHVGGKEASSIAVETIFRVVDNATGGGPAHILAESIREANRAIFSKGTTAPELKGMGSTCVAVLTHALGTEVAHVGDSRVYLLTQNQVYQVTKDHSLVQRLVDANMLTPEEAPNHPSANQITNALGMKPEVDVEVRPQPFPHTPGDTFILCSDGLSDEIGVQDIANILAPFPTAEQAARNMVDLANARGGHDNITVAIVRLGGGGPFAPTIPASRAPTPIAGVPMMATGGSGTTTLDMPVHPEANSAASSPMSQLSAPPSSSSSAMGNAPTSANAGYSAPHQAQAPFVAPAFGPPPTAPLPPTFSATPISERNAPQSRKGNGVLIAIIVVLLLALAGLGAAFFFRATSSALPEGPQPLVPEEATLEPAASTKKSVAPLKPTSPTGDDVPSTTTTSPSTSSSSSSGVKPPKNTTGNPTPHPPIAPPAKTHEDAPKGTDTVKEDDTPVQPPH